MFREFKGIEITLQFLWSDLILFVNELCLITPKIISNSSSDGFLQDRVKCCAALVILSLLLSSLYLSLLLSEMICT